MLVDFALTSLYGKLGSAGLSCEVAEFSKRNSSAKVVCYKEHLSKIWNALSMIQGTLDGQYAMRLVLKEVSDA
jgi:RNase P/RNase MRP subunit POP5